jgi:hypothetical protein
MFGHGQYVISLLPKYINYSEVRNPLRKTNLGQPSVRQLVVAMVEKALALGSLRVMIHGLLQVTVRGSHQKRIDLRVVQSHYRRHRECVVL